MTGNNLIINGNFQVWQRGAGGNAAFAVPASTTMYTADRWQVMTNANQLTTVSQQIQAIPGFFTGVVTRNAGQTGAGIMRFCTSLTNDMCEGVAGNIVTISFQIAVGLGYSPAGGLITMTVYSGTGTDKSGINGGFTGSSAAISQTFVPPAGSFGAFSFSSAALGSTVSQLAVEFSWAPTGTAGANDEINIKNIQLEISPKATNFEYKSFNEQLIDCQYFYSKSFNYNVTPAQNTGILGSEETWAGTNASTASGVSNLIHFPRTMRTTPTITLYNPAAANAQARNLIDSGGADCSSTTASTGGNRGFYVTYNGSASGIIGNNTAINWTADNELT